MSFVPRLTNDEVNALPPIAFPGTINLIETPTDADLAVQMLRQHSLVGFDTETKPAFKRGQKHKVALLQLATTDKAFLFRLNKFTLTHELSLYLSDPGITKIGLALHDDIKALNVTRKFNSSGFIDLQSIAKNYGIEELGLKKLTAIIMGYKLSKRQQTSNWEAPELSREQMVYAATDAWICREIYLKLQEIS